MVGAVHNAKDPVPGGLCLGRGAAQPLTDQCVHQGGLAHIRIADDIDEAAFHAAKVAIMRASGFRGLLLFYAAVSFPLFPCGISIVG